MQIFSNNAVSTLSAALAANATSLVVQPGHGVKFPVLGIGDSYPLTLCQIVNGIEANYEIVKVTARSSDTLTIVRGQEYTTPRAYGVGDQVSMRVTAATMAGLTQTVAEDAVDGYAGLTGFALNLKNALGTVMSNIVSAATAARTWTFPDKDITVAGTTNETHTNPTIKGYIEQFQALNPGAAVTINTANGTLIEITTTANITITLPAPVAGAGYSIIVAYGGVHTVTFAIASGTLNWVGGAAPQATSVAGKKDTYSFLSGATYTIGRDGGRNA